MPPPVTIAPALGPTRTRAIATRVTAMILFAVLLGLIVWLFGDGMSGVGLLWLLGMIWLVPGWSAALRAAREERTTPTLVRREDDDLIIESVYLAEPLHVPVSQVAELRLGTIERSSGGVQGWPVLGFGADPTVGLIFTEEQNVASPWPRPRTGHETPTMRVPARALLFITAVPEQVARGLAEVTGLKPTPVATTTPLPPSA